MQDIAFLQSVTLFQRFNNAELEALATAMNASDYGPNTMIIEEGSQNRALHVVRSGRVRVTQRVNDSEVTLCELLTGQTFGELSILDTGRASATLRAIPQTTILSISHDDLSRFLDASPAAASKFWKALAMDLRERIVRTNDVVRTYFEVNQALIENPHYREAYAMCHR